MRDKLSFSKKKKSALLADRDLRVVLDETLQANNNVAICRMNINILIIA